MEKNNQPNLLPIEQIQGAGRLLAMSYDRPTRKLSDDDDALRCVLATKSAVPRLLRHGLMSVRCCPRQKQRGARRSLLNCCLGAAVLCNAMVATRLGQSRT
jgi:hypothetical protein